MLRNGMLNSTKIPDFFELKSGPFWDWARIDEVSIIWVRLFDKRYNQKKWLTNVLSAKLRVYAEYLYNWHGKVILKLELQS